MPQPKRKVAVNKATPSNAHPDLIRVQTVKEAMDMMSPDALAMYGFMVNSGVTGFRDQPFITSLDAKKLAEDAGVPTSGILAALHDISMFECPVNDEGLVLRMVTVLGRIDGPDGEPESIVVYVVPIQRPESGVKEDA